MAALRTSLVRRRHAWTGEDIPWQMDAEEAPSGLFRYLSGGGLSAFGGSNVRTRTRRRQTRFFWAAAVFAALWTVFYFV